MPEALSADINSRDNPLKFSKHDRRVLRCLVQGGAAHLVRVTTSKLRGGSRNACLRHDLAGYPGPLFDRPANGGQSDLKMVTPPRPDGLARVALISNTTHDKGLHKMANPMIRATSADDIPGLKKILDGTELFPSEMLADMLAPFLAGETDAFWLTCLKDGEVAGLCYTAPEDFADGTWNMRALAVRPDLQGKGLGATLVKAAENHLKERGQRILIVDTSGTDDFALTRQFYVRNGYEAEARIRDYWAAGDDKVTFRKAL